MRIRRSSSSLSATQGGIHWEAMLSQEEERRRLDHPIHIGTGALHETLVDSRGMLGPEPVARRVL